MRRINRGRNNTKTRIKMRQKTRETKQIEIVFCSIL